MKKRRLTGEKRQESIEERNVKESVKLGGGILFMCVQRLLVTSGQSWIRKQRYLSTTGAPHQRAACAKNRIHVVQWSSKTLP